jgi:hypothetical protein
MFKQKDLMDKITELSNEIEEYKETLSTYEIEAKEMKSDFELKLREAIALKDIEHKEALFKMKEEYQNKLIDEKERLNQEFYGKMASELTKLHSEGNSQTKFVQDLALQMVKSSKPALEHHGQE